jgi:exopolysaccharide biosynthesis WecB/TagA/CpsF family protein
MSESSPRKKNVLGVMVTPTDYGSAADLILDAAKSARPFAVSALAVHGVMTGVLDREHRYRLNEFDLLVPDGQPVRWALNLLHGAKLKDRVYGPKLTLELLALASIEQLPVYFYGSTQEVLEHLCGKLRKNFPRLQIAGAEPSKFGKITCGSANAIADRIRDSGARLVFVGLGCPRQEVWAFEFRERLRMPVIAVGAAFPFIAGMLPQAPPWMQKWGLEWLFRLCQEPIRLWKRYLLLNPLYALLITCQFFGVNFSPSGTRPHREILYG